MKQHLGLVTIETELVRVVHEKTKGDASQIQALLQVIVQKARQALDGFGVSPKTAEAQRRDSLRRASFPSVYPGGYTVDYSQVLQGQTAACPKPTNQPQFHLLSAVTGAQLKGNHHLNSAALCAFDQARGDCKLQ